MTDKSQNKKLKTRRKLLTLLLVIAVLAVAWFSYIGNYYHATDRNAALSSTHQVQVSKTDFGYAFDGPGEDTALIFYPGAKVEDLAYAKLLKKIAAGGTDCYLVHMPCNLAIFGVNKADQVRKGYQADHWYLAGHSLGGAMAASYAAGKNHADQLDGLIFLAAYSTKDLKETDLKILSIYGSRDHVVNREKIRSGRKLMPEGYEEYIIKGGNHAGFGDYGKQKGDGKATISGEEQKRIAAEKILQMVKSEGGVASER